MASVRAFHHGKEFYRALEDEIKRARKEIIISVYSFYCDSVGKKLLAALKERAETGVSVKIILDGLGSRYDGREIARELEGTGVAVKIFRPRRYYLYRHPVSFLRRNHARIFLIDREILGLGGICVGEIYDTRQDLSLVLKISDARPIVSCFDRLWTLADGDNSAIHFADDSPQPLSVSPEIAALVSAPAKREQTICRWHLDRIKSAKGRIVVVSTWFLPAKNLLEELTAAKDRGVDVTIVTPFHTDKKWYDYFRGAAMPRLLRKGIVWHGTREYFHQKFSVIDDYWCLGSANFDMISMNRNYELNACGRGGAVLGELENNFKNLMASGGRTANNGIIRAMRQIGNIAYPLLEFFMTAGF